MATKIDYKLWFIRRNNDVNIDEVGVRFYEGDIVSGKYVRSKRLQRQEVRFSSSSSIVKESNGNDVFIYTPRNFGTISTDEQLNTFLNSEIARDSKRTPITEQT